MRNLLRHSLLAAATFVGLAAQAQQPYTWVVSGTVAGCYDGQIITLMVSQAPNGLPLISQTVALDAPDCTFYTEIAVPVNAVVLTATTQCGGASWTYMDSASFGAFPDTAYTVFNFTCGGSGSFDCNGVLNGPAMPGTPCTTPAGATGTWSADCDCDTGGNVIDCLGVPNGPNMPGTACTTFLGVAGTWSANCICIADSSNGGVDCLGIANGPNVPGAPCQNPATGVWGLWSADCTCDADSTGGAYDCLGQLNGPAQPGTPCWLLGANYIGVWDANCACVDSTNTGGFCAASFYAMQAYDIDSTNPNGVGTPIPYEIWVWNLSNGVDPMTYFWDFGDGSSSTNSYPTHAYSGNGPYLLCLTIADASGCTSTYCDSISIDPDGILNGLALDPEANGNEERANGFTINVQNPLTMGLTEAPAMADLRAWPNPAKEELYVALNARFDGAVTITIVDVNGREVAQESRSQGMGRNQHRIEIAGLAGGLYTARITDRTSGESLTVRFVKAR